MLFNETQLFLKEKLPFHRTSGHSGRDCQKIPPGRLMRTIGLTASH